MNYINPRILATLGGFLFGLGFCCAGMFPLQPLYMYPCFILSGKAIRGPTINMPLSLRKHLSGGKGGGLLVFIRSLSLNIPHPGHGMMFGH